MHHCIRAMIILKAQMSKAAERDQRSQHGSTWIVSKTANKPQSCTHPEAQNTNKSPSHKQQLQHSEASHIEKRLHASIMKMGTSGHGRSKTHTQDQNEINNRLRSNSSSCPTNSLLHLWPEMPDEPLHWPGSSISQSTNCVSLDLLCQFP